MIFDAILQEVRKTNPNMTMEKLLNELLKSKSGSRAFIIKLNSNKKG